MPEVAAVPEPAADPRMPLTVMMGQRPVAAAPMRPPSSPPPVFAAIAPPPGPPPILPSMAPPVFQPMAAPPMAPPSFPPQSFQPVRPAGGPTKSGAMLGIGVAVVLVGLLGAGAFFWMRGRSGGGGVTADDEKIVLVPSLRPDGKYEFTVVDSQAKGLMTLASAEWNVPAHLNGDFSRLTQEVALEIGMFNMVSNGGVIALPRIMDEFTRDYVTLKGPKGEVIHVDQFGGVTKDPKFVQSGRFRDGLAPARAGEGSNRPCGYIDRSQEMKIPFNFSECGEFQDGLALTEEVGGRGAKKFIDPSGKVVIGVGFDRVSEFHGGRARIQRKGKWGYLDKTGAVVIPEEYEETTDFAEGLACVKKGSLWGFIDPSGKVVIPFQYPFAQSFEGGYALAGEQNGVNIIDKSGKRQSRIPMAAPLSTGGGEYLFLSADKKWGLMNANGTIVRKPESQIAYSAAGYSVFFVEGKTAKDSGFELYGPSLHLSVNEANQALENPEPLLKAARIPVTKSLSIRLSGFSKTSMDLTYVLESASGNRTKEFHLGNITNGGKK